MQTSLKNWNDRDKIDTWLTASYENHNYQPKDKLVDLVIDLSVWQVV